MINYRETTVNINGITAVEYSQRWDFYAVRNDGEETIYISSARPDCTAGEDGVVSLPSGASTVIINVSEKTVYLNGSGQATVIGQSQPANPFKEPQKGGDTGLPEKAALTTMSWANINKVCQAGKASEYWSIGDTKSVMLSTGEEITVRIEDFDHDTLDTGEKAPVTFGMVDCLNTMHAMNSSDTNLGGWGASEMRTFMTTLLGQFPNDLQAVIKSVTKTTSEGNKSSILTTTNDKLWLFSHTEVNFAEDTNYSPGGEGTAYPLFIDNSSRIKKVNGSPERWWLRSPTVSYTMYFCSVNSSGGAGGNRAGTPYGVAVGFCL